MLGWTLLGVRFSKRLELTLVRRMDTHCTNGGDWGDGELGHQAHRPAPTMADRMLSSHQQGAGGGRDRGRQSFIHFQ